MMWRVPGESMCNSSLEHVVCQPAKACTQEGMVWGMSTCEFLGTWNSKQGAESNALGSRAVKGEGFVGIEQEIAGHSCSPFRVESCLSSHDSMSVSDQTRSRFPSLLGAGKELDLIQL